MNFIYTTPLIGNRITLATWQLYGLDLFMLGGVFAAHSSLQELSLFSHGLPQISMYSSDMLILGGLGMYGFRVASFVAIFRQCRKPQVLEWWICLVGFGVAIFFCLFSGLLLEEYASLHGYQNCRAEGFHRDRYLFVPKGLTCPPRDSSDK